MWIKRDDLTGLALGGNKARKIEYILGAAAQADIDTVVTVRLHSRTMPARSPPPPGWRAWPVISYWAGSGRLARRATWSLTSCSAPSCTSQGPRTGTN